MNCGTVVLLLAQCRIWESFEKMGSKIIGTKEPIVPHNIGVVENYSINFAIRLSRNKNHYHVFR